MAWGWLIENEPKQVATIDTSWNKKVVLDGNFVYNLLRYLFNAVLVCEATEVVVSSHYSDTSASFYQEVSMIINLMIFNC
jgi:hypothetical protein